MKMRTFATCTSAWSAVSEYRFTLWLATFWFRTFRSAFKVIVSGPLPSELAEAIFIEQFSAEYPTECEQTMVEASNPFLVLAAKCASFPTTICVFLFFFFKCSSSTRSFRYSSCPELAEKSLHQLFIRALRFIGSTVRNIIVIRNCLREYWQF